MSKLDYGYNIPALKGMMLEEIQTPCLLIDYETFKLNVEKMRSFTHENNIKLRPHAKMHKSVEVAKYQLQYGNASGICCQKLSEAEVFVRSGIKDILITNQITDLKKIDRLCKINRSGSKVTCCVDNIDNLNDINNIASDNNVKIEIFIELECGAQRCGTDNIDDIKLMIQFINKSSNIKLSGFQAYNGSNQHVLDSKERETTVNDTNKRISNLLKYFDMSNLIVTGGGTGCFEEETKSKIYNEIQVGSYAFMDAHYSSLKKNKSNILLENSLFIYTSVISVAKQNFAVVDAGLKSMSVDSGLPKIFNKNDLKYTKCSDEHGIIEDYNNSLKLNDKLKLIPGHCDPTCNLHDWYVVIDKNRKVKDLWKVSARGFSF